jgi:hypothetical protein
MNLSALRAIIPVVVGVIALPNVSAAADPTEPAKSCYLERAEFYARQTCDPAPFLTGAVFGSCTEAEAETRRLTIEDPRFQDLSAEFLSRLSDKLRAEWGPRIEAKIVDTRINEGLCH